MPRKHPPRSGVTGAYAGVNSTCFPLRQRRREQQQKEDLWIVRETQSSIADYVQTGKRRAEDNREINRSHRLIVGRGVWIISALVAVMKDFVRFEQRGNY